MNITSIVWMLKDASGIVIQAKFRRSHSERSDLYLEYKVELPEPPANLIPIEDLLESQVISWLVDAVGVMFEPIDEALQYHYESINANTEITQLPWA